MTAAAADHGHTFEPMPEQSRRCSRCSLLQEDAIHHRPVIAAERNFERHEHQKTERRAEAAEAEAAKAWEFEHKMMERATDAEEKLEAVERERDRLNRYIDQYVLDVERIGADNTRLRKAIEAELRRTGCLCTSSRCPLHGEGTGALAASLATDRKEEDA